MVREAIHYLIVNQAPSPRRFSLADFTMRGVTMPFAVISLVEMKPSLNWLSTSHFNWEYTFIQANHSGISCFSLNL
jgi:hypothetical protein